MCRPNWRTGAGHVVRWALVVEVVVVLHIATERIDDHRMYAPPASTTTSVATTHVCGTKVCDG